jgi:hypothetical protein
MTCAKSPILNSPIPRRWLLGIGVTLCSFLGVGALQADDDDVRIRWDIVSIDFATGTANPGGIASARANANATTNVSGITLTGSGTFPARGPSSDVTGGGTWKTRNQVDVITAAGSYKVTGLVRWDVAPGAFPLSHDNIGQPEDARAGLAVLSIKYSDGSRGILVVSCHIAGTPDSLFEGITASKGFVDYFNPEVPPAPPGDANRNLFHVVRHDDDNDDDN